MSWFVGDQERSVAEVLQVARDRVREGLREGHSGVELARDFAGAVTNLVRRVSGPKFAGAPPRWGAMAFCSVGGLARSELGPFADVDLVLLTRRKLEGEPLFDGFLRDLVHPLWDAGMRAHVTTHEPREWLEAARTDLTLCTGLLDLRFISGDQGLVEEQKLASRERFFGANRSQFLERLRDEERERHDRYGGTVYLVEPDLKHGPGGLRDLASLQWTHRATYETDDLPLLAGQNLVPPRMAAALDEARGVLLRLRAALHLAARRAQERLVFQYQELVPPLLHELPKDLNDADLVRAIERTMQDYYRAAQTLLRYGARLQTRCRPPDPGVEAPPRRIDERFAIVGRRLVHDPSVPLMASPVLALDALNLSRDCDAPLSGPTFDAVAEATANPADLDLHADPEAQRRFMDLLTHPDDVGHPSSLELANELGVIEAVVPEFGPIRGRMQHDAYHVYTVDQHTLAALAMLKRLARGEHNKDYPLATALHLEIDDPRVLYLATLVHDAGKARVGDQCETGAAIATEVAARANLSSAEIERCSLLVREHLTMPLLSQKRDISDPLLIAEFAKRIGERQALRELYLLSLVDTASVRPGNLTAWKLTLLDELYLQASAHLRRGTIVARRQIVRADEPENLPDRYYGLFHQEMRKRHGVLVERLEAEGRTVLLELEFGSGALRLTLVGQDRPGLLAQVTATLDEHGVEVLAADVFSANGLAVDVFRVEPVEGPEQGIDAETITQIEQELQDPLPKEALAAAPQPRTPPPWSGAPRTPTRIVFDRDPSGERTIVEIVTEVSSDLLRRITRAFAVEGLEILIARTNAEANRASNVFYVDALEPAEQEQLATRLRAYLA